MNYQLKPLRTRNYSLCEKRNTSRSPKMLFTPIAILMLSLFQSSFKSTSCFTPLARTSNPIRFFSSLQQQEQLTKQQQKEVNVISNPKLLQYQKQADSIASSFSITPYNPAPIFTNPHFQTISGVFLRDQPIFSYWDSSNLLRSQETETEWTGWDERERITTPDGDFFDVDIKYHKNSRGRVVMTHGLESNSNSSLSMDMAMSFWKRGFEVACVNFRGCSGEPNLTTGGYHLGFTDDLKLYLSTLRDRGDTNSPLYLSGFSLGANVVLKLLGELGEAAMDEYNIQGAAVTGAPFNVSKHYIQLEKPGINSMVYTPNFLKTMKRKAKDQYERFNGNVPFDLERILNANTIATIEDAYIAPIYGFDDNFDYYEKTSCGYFLKGIAVPTLVINARDDPFFDPTVEPEVMNPNPLKYICTEYGGHLGFMFHVSDEKEVDQSVSWMSTELGRFVEHVHENKPLQ